jgi:tRNA (guanine-N7-)-methyltransferase
MAKHKLRNFAELETFSNVIQHMFLDADYDHTMKGNWAKGFFKNDNPITLELGCGKGEYCVGLARLHPERNYLGIDIKGNRLWRGAKTALEEGMSNVGFIRTQVDRINNLFAPGEIAEIWITFPDPKPKKGDARKRLTSKENTDRYRVLLSENGSVHLKTDSLFNVEFTQKMIDENGYRVLRSSADIDTDFPGDELLKIRTYYEQKFRAQGIPIHYIRYIP